MAELQNRFKKIMQDIEEHIQDKEELEYIKTQIYNISTLFLDELDKLADLNMDKMNALIERHVELNERISKVEGTISNIEKELFVEDWSYFEIVCPYCNNEFVVDLNSEKKDEVICPECKNIIELDWNEEEHNHCNGHCGGCHSDCGSEEEQEDDDDDDDM